MCDIRDYREDDLGELINMVSLVLGEYSMSIDKTGADKELEDMGGVYGQHDSKFFIMESRGKIIGSVGVRNIDRDTCELRKLYLLKEYRGRGLGQELLDHALAFAVNKGYKKIQLEVSVKHERAISLYERSGFMRTDRKSSCPRCEFIFEKNKIMLAKFFSYFIYIYISIFS